MNPSKRRWRGRQTNRGTPPGTHVPVMLNEVLSVLAPQPGDIVIDCTLGYAGHANTIADLLGPDGRLLAFDLDPLNLEMARERLQAASCRVDLHHGNFAAVQSVMGELGIPKANALLADLGMSSLQLDDPDRGFSYVRDGPLDMRMDRTRGRTAAEILATISISDLAPALRDLGDEPRPDKIAHAIVAARDRAPLERTGQLAELILHATEQFASKNNNKWKPRTGKNEWQSHPAARTFQALRILVNRELANLEHLLRILPQVLAPGGRAAIISFHSGEDRLVKSAFREGRRLGTYDAIAEDPMRPTFSERLANARSRSAKLRWARRSY